MRQGRLGEGMTIKGQGVVVLCTHTVCHPQDGIYPKGAYPGASQTLTRSAESQSMFEQDPLVTLRLTPEKYNSKEFLCKEDITTLGSLSSCPQILHSGSYRLNATHISDCIGTMGWPCEF